MYMELQIDHSATHTRSGVSYAEDALWGPVPGGNYKAILGGNQAWPMCDRSICVPQTAVIPIDLSYDVTV